MHVAFIEEFEEMPPTYESLHHDAHVFLLVHTLARYAFVCGIDECLASTSVILAKNQFTVSDGSRSVNNDQGGIFSQRSDGLKSANQKSRLLGMKFGFVS